MTRSKVFTYPLDHLPPSSYTSLFTLSSTTSVRSPPTSGGSTASDRCHRTRVHSLKAASNRRRNSQLFRRPDEEEDEAKHFTVRSWQDMAKSKSGRSSLSRDQLTRRSTADGSASSTIEPFFVARRSIDSNRRSNSVDSATNSSGSSTSNHRLIVSCSPHFSPTDTASSSLACIPNRKRSCTDRLFLLLLAVALTVSGISLFNTVFVQRVNVQFVLSGHDDWGNICGQTNEPIEGALWSGQNMTTRRYMLLRLGRNHSINSICIENCAFNDYL